MRTTETNEHALVVAAQAGDRRALDELLAAHLPLVYTIVRRALSGHPDADDVVQETMLRAVRELPHLRTPDSFRAWLAAIAVRQVVTQLSRRRRSAQRLAPLDAVLEHSDPDAEVESLTMLQLELSEQRRQVLRAGGWLDPDDRALLSLWWLEVAGTLSRGELASALGISVAHAGVRVQRMRTQLELARSVVAAIEARPRCTGLDTVLAGWDGTPSPLWRKRLGRHTRSCPRCGAPAGGMVATERLLVGFALLPVPLALSASVFGKGTAAALGASGAKVGLVGWLAQAFAAHPVVSTLVAGTVVAGAAVTTTQTWPHTPPPPAVVAAPPSGAVTAVRPPIVGQAAPAPSATRAAPAPTITLAVGAFSLEAANEAGFFAATTDTYGVLTQVGSGATGQTRQLATFTVVAGLNDAACFSFRLPDGRYLRHSSWRLRVYANDGSQLFRGDATFCPRTGAVPGSIMLESSNYPGWFLRHRGNELWVDHSDGSAAFAADGSFRVRAALTG